MPDRSHKADATPSSVRRDASSLVASTNGADLSVVGIGASAGGLDACRKLLEAVPHDSGVAFVLVQHLDPNHESMMVDLLAGHTALAVQQAIDGMPIERDHLFIIPPGTYLSVANGVLHLSPPQARHGARLPFDFLLHSLAEEYGARASCVILSGTGADGSLGLKAIKENGGLVIAQDPDDAGFDGMPRSAIMTGAVDLVLPAAKIAEALIRYSRRSALAIARNSKHPSDAPPEWLPAIIDLLRTNSVHDFTHYKQGTLQRRIERRMAMAAIDTDDMNRYLEILRNDPAELRLLAEDLLINVTSFFRDRKVFDFLAETVIPELVGKHTLDKPLRVWIAGCSTGAETYSLAMLFQEAIAAAKRNIRLQIFASDVDSDAVGKARDGLYPQTIEADVSEARLRRFFTKEEHGYRISPDLRALVVFTVQDVLSDPPFSRIDLISCRNLLIYLLPEAQAKVISLFHFALREGGVLLLGSAETIGRDDHRFEVVSKSERVYRHIGGKRSGEFGVAKSRSGGPGVSVRPGFSHGPIRLTALAELCRRLVLENYAPAAILINSKHESLYSLGPIDRYLRVARGHPNLDVLAMARPGLRTRLRSAIQQATQERTPIVIGSGPPGSDDNAASFNIAVQPVQSGGEDLLLICFIDEPAGRPAANHQSPPENGAHAAALEKELEVTRAELQSAIRDLETSNEEQKAVNEEALSVNEEYQSTNEELLTSKEELQSLNEELNALNGQLQETLEHQRTTSNDLQNVLYSTDVATLFLDARLNIRFYTPATESLFSILPGDVGRPLADLSSLAADDTLLTDAGAVLKSLVPIEKEIKARQGGAWYVRRILPYRTQNDRVEGVVITFVNVTERRHTADALAGAKKEAEIATIAKSRFLAAASHDLRQPLQTLSLIQGLLAKIVEGERAQNLVARVADITGAMAGMLNALLDINQIEAGTVHAEIAQFPIDDVLERLRGEFGYLAEARGLSLRTVACGITLHSDPRLLEQMIRNLLANALKYTKQGKVLLGCRRRNGILSIEVWDSGVGIPSHELQAIFEDYHQLDNAVQDRRRGLGLGLAIVKRLSDLLGCRIRVRSWPGKGSVFAVEVALPVAGAVAEVARNPLGVDAVVSEAARRTGQILVVEDDPEVRELLEIFLKDEGHRAVSAPDGTTALELMAREAIRPDLILADYNLPDGMDGIKLTQQLRNDLNRHIPVIILTGDISTKALRDIAVQDCVQLNKPVKLPELARAIQHLLPAAPSLHHRPSQQRSDSLDDPAPPLIFVVDDDRHAREGIRGVLEQEGWAVEDHDSCEAFLESYRPGHGACLLVDAYLPGMTGIELLRRLNGMGNSLPAIMITGNSDVSVAVQAMRAGAVDFVEKPISGADLIACIKRALTQSKDTTKLTAWREEATERVATLTSRQREIMEMVLAGQPSKNIAADLGISQRTVENHRASIMKRTGSKSLPALARLALAAASQGSVGG